VILNVLRLSVDALSNIRPVSHPKVYFVAELILSHIFMKSVRFGRCR